MSLGGLVAYDSSDESEDEVISDNEKNTAQTSANNASDDSTSNSDNLGRSSSPRSTNEEDDLPDRGESSLFQSLPKPRTFQNDLEENDDIPVPILPKVAPEVPLRRDKGPVKISIPSLSDFKDVDEEIQQRKSRIQPSAKGTGLFAVLPPPSSSLASAKNLVPAVLAKPQTSLTPSQVRKPHPKPQSTPQKPVAKSSALNSLKYDSNSEDEDDDKPAGSQKGIDFFSLDKSAEISIPEEAMAAHMLPPPVETNQTNLSEPHPSTFEESYTDNRALTSTVMNLPRDEILLKNQAEVGPKLPVPEQEFHVDSDGNVAFDEKAIEYLCGKRGVKRKNELIQGANIIHINGEDIKPDEREWLVKALTEQPVQRPVSLSSAGPSSASKKKHQITYLAHQAKAMEVELQNQWAANRLARKQTRSKYGF